MVHFRMQVALQTIRSFCDDREMGFLRVRDQVFADPGQSLIPKVEVDGFLSRGLEVLFDQIFYLMSAFTIRQSEIIGVAHRSTSHPDCRAEYCDP